MLTERKTNYAGELMLYEPELQYGFEQISPYEAAGTVAEMLEKTPAIQLVPIIYGKREGSPLIIPEHVVYELVTEIPARDGVNVLLDFEAHPGDFDDMKPRMMFMVEASAIYEEMATYGERGAEPFSPEQTIAIRKEEVKDAGIIIPRTSDYLQSAYGENFPDGELMFHIALVKESVKQKIQEKKPRIIMTHAYRIDHPDHFAMHIAVMSALRELSREEGYEPPAVYTSEPEFGFESGGQWAFDQVNRARGTRRIRYNQPQVRSLEAPEYIVDTSAYGVKGVQALFMHRTQMGSRDGMGIKDYALRIPSLARYRGDQVGGVWGEGLYQIKIPGVTSQENKLASYLPSGVMYQRKKRLL